MKAKRITIFLVLAALVLLPSIGLCQEKAEGEDRTLRLPIGDPNLKSKVVDVTAGEIVSARAGKPLPFVKMIREMKDSRFIYVGESHDNMMMHDIQFKVIQGLFEQDPAIAIGLEMLPAECQPVLDKWTQGALSKEDFIRQVNWYVHWSMNFGYYEKILDFARENRIPVFGLNAPRHVISKIRMKDWEALTDEEKALVPEPDVSNEDHRTLIRTIFESSEIPHAMKGEVLDKMFDGLYRAQSAWDEVMAANAIRGAEREKRRMVVLVGSGHLFYNLGINRRVYEANRMPFRTVVSLELAPEEKSLAVAGSFADYIWGIPEQEQPAYPAIGLALKKIDGLENLVLERKPIDGLAAGGDFEKGDVVLSVDGKTYVDINELRIHLAEYKWGDEAKVRLLRGGEVREATLKFEYKPRAEKTDEKAEKKPPEKMKMAMVAGPKSDRIDRLRRHLEKVVKRSDGEVGVAIRHLESGQELELNAGTAFPMASVFKLPVLVEVMAQVKEGEFSLDDEVDIKKPDQHLGSGILSSLTAPGIKLTVRNVVNLMMLLSDNSAADILLEKVGAENVNKRMKQYGIEGITVNRSCQELIMDRIGMDYEKYKGKTLDEIVAAYQNIPERSAEDDRESIREFSLEIKDQSTPSAMNTLLTKIWKKEILDPESCDLIISIMLRCQTGQGRIKGELPPGTAVAHKTGTIAGTVNDAGIITLPDGQGHVALTVFSKNFSEKTEDVEKIIAEVARLVYDYFYFTN
ncbi:MAG TPA: class A beta-lactamase [Candidatus Desulfaltia sp.]|nr:class A beta-lactamase [Candidatus Desulfaltia sp.]